MNANWKHDSFVSIIKPYSSNLRSYFKNCCPIWGN